MYQLLADECIDKRWKTWNLQFEMGIRGFLCQSPWRALGLLGITGADRKTTCQTLLWRKRQKECPDGYGYVESSNENAV